MSRKCPNCDAVDSMETDSIGTEDLALCTNCGFTEKAQGSQFVAPDKNEERGEFQRDGLVVKFDKDRKLYSGRTKTDHKKRKFFMESADRLGLPEASRARVVEVYDTASVRVSRKTASFTLACLFVACERIGLRVSLKEFCRKLECDKRAITKARTAVCECLDDSPSPLNSAATRDSESLQNASASAESLVVQRLNENRLPFHYEKKLTRLMSLVRKAWVSSGKSEEGYLWPCLFVLLEANAPCAKSRPKSRVKSVFMDRYGVHQRMHQRTFCLHVQEVEEFLKRMTSYVPWLSADLKGSILGINKSLDWMLNNADYLEGVIEDANRRSDDAVSEFRPPAMDAERKNAVVAEDVPDVRVPEGELGEEDIKEDDFHQYIKSPKEVRNLIELKTRFKSSS